MKTTSSLKSLLALAALLMTPVAQAAVQVSSSLTAPTENIFAFNEPEGPYGGENATTAYYTGQPRTNNPQYRQVGVAFTLGAHQSGDLTSVTWKIMPMPEGVLGKGFSIDIYKTLGQGDAPSPQTLISSQTGNLPGVANTEDTYFTFSLDQPVALSESSTYVVVFAFTEPTSPGTSVVSYTFRTTGNAVENSEWQRWLYEGSSNNPQDNVWKASADVAGGSGSGNRNQPIIYLGGTVAIPEPSTYALAAVGIAGLLGMRFLRNEKGR